MPRWSRSGVVTSRRERRRLAAIRVPDACPARRTARERDVRAALAERARRRHDALTHLRRGLGTCTSGRARSAASTCRHGDRARAPARRARPPGGGGLEGARGAASSGPSGPGCWRAGYSRFGYPATTTCRPISRSCARWPAPRIRRASSAARQAELRQRVRERAWQHRGSGEYDDPATLADVRSRLGERRALVAHVVTAERVVALVVTAEAARVVHLGARSALDALIGGLLPDLDMAAAELAGFADVIRAELRGRLQRLDDLLVAPLTDLVDGCDLVLTPSGALAAVPWTILPGNRGRPVTVAQSATSWLARGRRPLRSRSAGFVAGPRVAQAEAEIRAAPRPGPERTVLHGDRGDGRRGQPDLAGSVDVLHVAAHGRHSVGEPAVLRLRAGRRSVVRLRHRPAAPQSPTWCCSRRARSAARRCAGARS